MDAMSARGWSLNGLHHPPAVHVCTTLAPHRARASRSASWPTCARASPQVRDEPPAEGGMAPVYGMAAQMPDRGAVAAMLAAFMDLWFSP